MGVKWVLVDAIENQVLIPPPAESKPSFWSEFQDYWVRVPDKWIFFTMLAGWCVLFQFVGTSSFNSSGVASSLFEWMYNAWDTPAVDCSHGKLIPFAVAILFWLKRRELTCSMADLWWPGLAVLGVALLIHILGFLSQQPRVSMLALFLGLYGLIGVVWGRRTMWLSSFPMVLFAFCVPLGNMADVVTLPMRTISVTLTRMICHGLLDLDVVQMGTSLLDAKGKYEFDVVAACSGIHGLVASLAIAVVVAMHSLRSLWKRALMLFCTAPLAILGNVLRLTVVVLVGEAYGQAPAMWVHDWFGYVTYLTVNIGLLLVLAHWLKEKPSPKSA